MTPIDRALRICATQADDQVAYVRFELEQTIVEVLDRVGSRGSCPGCGAEIWWVKHLTGKPISYSRRGVMHLIDCAAAAKDFKRPHRKASTFS